MGAAEPLALGAPGFGCAEARVLEAAGLVLVLRSGFSECLGAVFAAEWPDLGFSVLPAVFRPFNFAINSWVHVHSSFPTK